MIRWSWRSIAVTLVLLAVALPPPAGAFPSYSRKYATSCGTCHTIYPKLTQFGEAFRRNGYRFPGMIDSDYIKPELVPMGQEAAKKDFPNSTWPSFITAAPQLGFTANSRVTIHPDRSSAAALKDNRTVLALDRLGTSASIQIAGAIDDAITVLGMVSLSDTAASIDETLLVWSDIVGPRHLASLSFGYAVPTITPFARTSSYGGRLTAASAMGTLYGWSGAPFRVSTKYSMAELNGMLGGRFEYGAGLANGTHDGVRSAGNFYGHVGAKLGGMRLDGEGSYVASDPTRPWAETSATAWAFAYRANVRFAADAIQAKLVATDVATTLGGGLRVNLGSAELTVGGLWEDHSHITAVAGTDGLPGPSTQVAGYGELSYIVFPWLVPAVRVEHLVVSPRGLASASATRLLPLVSMTPRPNMKVSVTASLERTSGPPLAGGDWSKLSGDGFNQVKATTTPVGLELSVVSVSASYGF